jgi:uncharacterized delta-60 repeat protein
MVKTVKHPKKITSMVAMMAAIIAIFTSGKEVFGQLDPTFNPPYFAVPDFATHALLLPDGKYVVYFNIETLSDQPAGAITRYLADGTLDTSFNFSRDYGGVSAAAGLANGKLIVATGRVTYGSFDQNHQTERILRLNADGSIDSSFSSTARTTDGGVVRAIAIQPDGKILVGGYFTAFNGSPRRGIVRLLSDGTVDPNFAAVTMTDPPMPLGGAVAGLWTEPKVQANGKIIIAGDFIGVNGTPCPGVARLNANGSLDSTFQASGFVPTGTQTPRPIRGIAIQSNGQIVIGGKFTVSASFASNHTGMTYTRLPLIRLNSNGSADQSYGYFGSMDTADSTFYQIRALVIQPDNKVIGVDNSVFRFNTNGSLDATFRQPDLLVDRADSNFDLEAFTINLRTDGRILIGGDFSDVDDAPPLPANGERWGVAEFNSDGTLDSFTTSHRQAQNAYPTSFLRQANGLTLIAFNQAGFSSGKTAIPHSFGRLLRDGSLDTGFDPLASIPLLNPAAADVGFSLLPNGNILVSGTNFLTGNFGYDVLKLDGTVANPNYVNDPNVGFNEAFPQPLTNGQVLVLNSPPGAQLVIFNAELQRINSSGSLDTSFVLDPSILANTVQRDMRGAITDIASDCAILAILPTGKILFSYLAFDNTYRLVQLNSNGSLDTSFQGGSVPASTKSFLALIFDPYNQYTPPQVPVIIPSGGVPGFSDAQLVGNQIVVVGQFASYAGVPAHGIVRLNANGTVDSTFNAGNGAQWTHTTETSTFHPSIDNIEQAGNGKFLITGTFEAFNGVALPGIALLNPNGSLDTSFVPPATRQKFDYHTAYLAKQPDNSFLLSGPYSLPNQTQSPSFIHIPSFGPVVTTNPATNVASFSATLNGSLNPNGSTTTVYFQYGPTTGYGFATAVQTQTGNTVRAINANIGNLSVNTTYHFRMVAHNADGTAYGSDRTFTTLGATGPPVVVTNPATFIATFSAILNGSVDPHGLTTFVYFQYGTTTGYGSTTLSQVNTGNTYQSVSANISSLAASTTYHFRIVATNSAGTRYGADRTFTTLSATGPPLVITNPATNVTGSSATLNGSVNPHGLSTTVYFQYGTTTSYGHTTASQTKSGSTYQSVSANISGLSASTAYHFRIVATNSSGTTYGSDKTFTTP